jgi:hypothetical protein
MTWSPQSIAEQSYFDLRPYPKEESAFASDGRPLPVPCDTSVCDSVTVCSCTCHGLCRLPSKACVCLIIESSLHSSEPIEQKTAATLHLETVPTATLNLIQLD